MDERHLEPERASAAVPRHPHDLIEARAAYAACGFVAVPAPTAPPDRFLGHWFEKPLT